MTDKKHIKRQNAQQLSVVNQFTQEVSSILSFGRVNLLFCISPKNANYFFCKQIVPFHLSTDKLTIKACVDKHEKVPLIDSNFQQIGHTKCFCFLFAKRLQLTSKQSKLV